MPPLVRIAGVAGPATAPERFTIARVDVMRKLFKKTGWSVDSVDLFEIDLANRGGVRGARAICPAGGEALPMALGPC
jgi:hypothetical protein